MEAVEARQKGLTLTCRSLKDCVAIERLKLPWKMKQTGTAGYSENPAVSTLLHHRYPANS